MFTKLCFVDALRSLEMITCHKCKQKIEIASESKYCPNCGTKISIQEALDTVERKISSELDTPNDKLIVWPEGNYFFLGAIVGIIIAIIEQFICFSTDFPFTAFPFSVLVSFFTGFMIGAPSGLMGGIVGRVGNAAGWAESDQKGCIIASALSTLVLNPIAYSLLMFLLVCEDCSFM
ncbi:MAG: hypothetical protein GY796_14695 [Chloroflexi bacterium]|nr:hypothetical protein [Chloroflexota bacterium]